MGDERFDYEEIRTSLLDLYYVCCRRKLHHAPRHGGEWHKDESEIGFAYGEFCDSYDLPIENIMLEVLALILRAGRGPEQAQKYHYNKIVEILSSHSLEELFKDIGEEERNDLLYDMKLLKLIE